MNLTDRIEMLRDANKRHVAEIEQLEAAYIDKATKQWTHSKAEAHHKLVTRLVQLNGQRISQLEIARVRLEH